MSNREEYRELCRKESSLPIFSQDWWLDAVCGRDNWNVVVAKSGTEIQGALPFYINKKYGYNLIKMPFLTQKLGLWIKYPQGQKYETRLRYEQKVMEELIRQLPNFSSFRQNFDNSITNWLPFYWKGYKQTTRYTYVIEDLNDTAQLYENLKGSIRTDIKKASKKVVIRELNDIEKFYVINKMTFERQGKPMPYSLQFLQNLNNECEKRNCKKIYFAVDQEEKVHSALYLVWDNSSTYYLMGGGDPALRNSGAMSLLIWEAINFTANQKNVFDFEGSMIQPIERFFKSFGAIQKPYFEIFKINSPILKVYNLIKEI